MQKLLATGLFVVFGVLSSYSAPPILNETFSVPAESHLRWTALTADNSPLVFSGGSATIDNPGSIYSGFAIHFYSAKLAVYSSSARITSNAAGTGIMCYTGSDDGVLTGCAVVSGDNELVLLSYDKAGVTQVARAASRFTNAFENTLSLAGNGKRIAVFCNGFFQFSYPDTFGSAAGVAIVVPPQARATFDDVVVTGSMSDTLAFSEVADSLNTIPSWMHVYGNGFIDSVQREITAASGSNEELYAGIDVPVGDFSMSIDICPVGADTSARVGFFTGRKDSAVSGGVAPVVRFGVSLKGRCVVDENVGGGFGEVVNKAFGDVPDIGSWSTIALYRVRGRYTFCSNGDTLLVLDRSEKISFSLGMFVADSMHVKMKNLRCSAGGNDGTAVVTNKKYQTNTVKQPQFSKTVDLSGRKYTDRNYRTGNHRVASQCVIREGKKNVTGVKRR